MTPALVRLCVNTVLSTRSHGRPRVPRALRHAERRLGRLARGGAAARWTALTDLVYRYGAAQRAMARSIEELRFAAGPEAAVELLRSAIDESRQLLSPGVVEPPRATVNAARVILSQHVHDRHATVR